ncbi:hypothetical protein MHYP_G00294130 [Metynnis hypsauchen]
MLLAPPNVDGVSVASRSETELTLEWNKVDNINVYSYRLTDNSGLNSSISGLEGDSVVRHTVSGLSPGTNYSFTLYTVFEGVESSGYSFSSITASPNVDGVSVVSRSETELTLEWNKVNSSSVYSYRLTDNNGLNSSISGSEEDSVVRHTVSGLSPGNKYSFTLYTVFEGVDSSGYSFSSVTTPLRVDGVSVASRSETELTLEWNKVNSSSVYSYRLTDDNGLNSSISGSEGDSVVRHTVSGLSPGNKYSFTLYTVFEGVDSSGHNFSSITIPATLTLRCEYASGGYGLGLVWGPPVGKRTSVLVNINGKSFNESDQRGTVIGGLQPAQWYTLTATAESEGIWSASASITCQTDPRGVIAGVLVFLLLVILIFCIGVFLWRRQPQLFRPISLKEFPKHFNSMSRDENHGFKMEFEELSAVGAIQSHKAALLPENKSKNRFPSVLAYDSSRVKLTVQNGSDYINASYIPGYASTRTHYIAAQGPLASTVSDFWRMVWEQKSQAIVMLINCMESGKVMCNQYWPLNCTPCTYGDLLVTVQSKKKEKSWILREFVVSNVVTSEKRRVKHFHFTAWPDDGVPRRTNELIQFCGIVRRHIESFSFTGPPVVHCSAGVDRTGTLIALDMLLQQLENEEAVSVAACVHHLRLSRPHMVQTESQSTSPASTVTSDSPTTRIETTMLPPPSNVDGVSVASRSETELTLEWNKVDNSSVYSYRLTDDNGLNSSISGSEEDSVVRHTVSDLSPGTNYSFTLYTVFEGVESSGYSFSSVTTPSNVDGVSVASRNETELTLEWNKVNSSSVYSYRLTDDSGLNSSISGSEEDSVVRHTVSDLSPGTNYSFTLYTVFEGVESSGYSFSSVTSLPKVSEQLNAELEQPLDEQELHAALQSMEGGTAPGIDGLPVEFYKAFWAEIGADWLAGLNETLVEGSLPLSCKRAVITLLPKKEDLQVIKNWRPVSLLCTDLKVFSKALAIRLRDMMGHVIHLDQTYCVPGRTITDNICLIRDVLEVFNILGVDSAPSNVDGVSVASRNETELTLEWNKVNSSSVYSYRLTDDNGLNSSISGLEGDSVVRHTVSDLSPGAKYSFTLYTVFEGVESSGHNFSSVTTPLSVDGVSVASRSETELTLEWNKVNSNSSVYSYRLTDDNGQNSSINGSEGDSVVTHTVSGLSPGAKYSFTLYTVFEGVDSSGHNFSSVTTPLRVDGVSVASRSETELTLEWNKVNSSSVYSYRLTDDNGQNSSISGSEEDSVVRHTVSGLSPGTNYSFTLYTVFEGVESSGHNFSSVTTPLSVDGVSVASRSETELTLEWNKVDNSSVYSYRLTDDNGLNSNISGSVRVSVVRHTVSGLSPGTKYSFTLYTVFEGVDSSGHNFSSVTVPTTVTDLYCKYASGGYGLVLGWGPPVGQRTSVLINLKSKTFTASGESLSIGGLQPAQWYTLTATAESEGIQSASASITCQTDPRGVIAGVLVFLLLAILILCIGIFICRRKPELSRVFRKSKSSVETKESSDKYKPVSLKKFPEHFDSMSRDENRGFSEEYEDLSTVGTDQSRTAALLPENKSKNRFTNVLAYDSSRVKLTPQNDAGSDYINANYMAGYGSYSKQYIAAQGPLPSTVSDFWRMVWEQKSQAIVMLTNCTESGRVKCEQYWPLDYTPCAYGNLLVTIQSEEKQNSWTLREFVVRDKATSEERIVKHLHFTAWPDHGVPRGTEDLIRFRGIVRQHIESFPFTGPTVVHCSAGVGRTGTLIALDILLQQLVKEEAVSIAACVHRMRLSRPLMVQTESQYVFLHQCIMDSLQPKEDGVQESIYENSDMIYANAMALRQYRAANPV